MEISVNGKILIALTETKKIQKQRKRKKTVKNETETEKYFAT